MTKREWNKTWEIEVIHNAHSPPADNAQAAPEQGSAPDSQLPPVYILRKT